MIRPGIAVLAGTMVAAGAAAQSQASAPTPVTSSTSANPRTVVGTLPSGTAINAQLNSSVDSKKAKAGDKVEAHTTEAIKYDGKIILPQGAKLEGHIMEATARSKGDSGSTLAIQFDRAIPKKSEEISLHVAILAIAAPPSEFSGGAPGPGSDPMSGAGASAAGGSPMSASRPQAPPSGNPSYPGGAPSSTMGSNGAAQLSANSRGVYGLNDLKLMEDSSNASQTTVITSSGKNVHLDSGTRFLLVSQPEAPSAASKQ